MKLTLGFSPCPNDTFIFDALVNKKIDIEDFDFEPQLEDVQTLNQWALQGKLDVTKISYGVLPLVLESYQLLSSGGALGKGVGPLLISKTNIINIESVIDKLFIAIPGEHTTAHMLFTYAFPQAKNKRFMVFNQIENAVLSGEVDAGVIIHENRFTYHEKGLLKLIDLGEYWEQQTHAPIPLGGIVVKRIIADDVKQRLEKLIRQSIEYAFHRLPTIASYVSRHAQEMSEEVMRKHIDLYVNNYSLELGEDGKAAVEKLLDIYGKINNEQR